MLKNLIPEWYWPKTILVDGVEIKIRNTPYSFGTRWLLRKGLYESEERALIMEILQPGMHVLEMGGSIGIVTAVMANIVGTKGKLITVEASKTLSTYSRQWLCNFGNVTVVTGYAFPVWHAPKIDINNFEQATGSLGGTLKFKIDAHGQNFATNDSSLYDIQRLCHEFDLKPNVLVVDVEGSEILMSTQTLNFPDTIKSVVIELHDWLYPRGRLDEDNIHTSFLHDGFALHRRVANVCLYTRN